MAGYVKIGDIQGESKDAGHKNWIELRSISQELLRPMKAGAGGAMRHRASVDVGDVIMTKVVDKSSARLMEAVCKGTNYPEVQLDLCTSSEGQKRTPYMRFTLKDARVTRYTIGGSTEDGAVPMETIAINFREIRWTYDVLDDQNRSRGKVEATWNVEAGTP